MAKQNLIVSQTQHPQYNLNEMSKPQDFRPFKHKKTNAPVSDLEYLLLLGEQIALGAKEWEKAHPHREYKAEGIDPSVQQFAQIIYKGYCDGISKEELKAYIRDSIDLDS